MLPYILRKNLSQEQAKKFSWEKAAKEMIKIFENLR